MRLCPHLLLQLATAATVRCQKLEFGGCDFACFLFVVAVVSFLFFPPLFFSGCFLFHSDAWILLYSSFEEPRNLQQLMRDILQLLPGDLTVDRFLVDSASKSGYERIQFSTNKYFRHKLGVLF